MASYYQIVPKKESGWYYVCRDLEGNHILGSKREDMSESIILFDSEEQAQNYIDLHLDDNYQPQWCIMNGYTPCPDCGGLLTILVSLGADETGSGLREELGECRNKKCNSMWALQFSTNPTNLLRATRRR